MLLMASTTCALAVPKTSDRPSVFAVPPSVTMMDFGCPNGSFVSSISYNIRTQQGVQVQCRNRTSADAGPPPAPSLANCQSCVITPTGAKRLNGTSSATAGFCVYDDFPNQAC